MRRQVLIASSLLLLTVLGSAAALAAWKVDSIEAAEAAAAEQPEWVESVSVAAAEPYQARGTTTAIGTVLATRSVTLRNEIAGTVAAVALSPGRVVGAGTVLVQLDVSVEEAELAALEAEAALAETLLARYQHAVSDRAVSAVEVDRARAERDVARARIAQTRAVIARKTIRAPFRARVGLADVHRGQFLDVGTELTTLQGVDGSAQVDFSVAQRVAAGLRPGGRVAVFVDGDLDPLVGTIVAVDARVDPTTRNALARARIEDVDRRPAPGASVRVEIQVGEARSAVVVPASALRRGPQGDHVFVVEPDGEGRPRAHARPVETGPALGDRVVIHGGLEAGEQVATAGSFKLRDAMPVAVAADRAASLAPAAGSAD